MKGVFTLKDRQYGMSSDEYAGGAFSYGENLDIYTKQGVLMLSPSTSGITINNRSGGKVNTLVPAEEQIEVIALTNDGYIESYTNHNRDEGSTGVGGGAFYRIPGGTAWRNGILFGGTLVTVTNTKLYRFVTQGTGLGYGLLGSNQTTTPDLTADTGWTVGTGWATGVNGAVHTAGNTASLSQDFSFTDGDLYRITIRLTSHTAGTLTVNWRSGNIGPTISASAGYDGIVYTYVVSAGAGTDTLSLDPSSTFDGTVNYVTVSKYDDTNVFEEEVTLTSDTRHPLLYDNGILYVGSGDRIEYIDTSLASWVIDDTLVLGEGDEIVSMTKTGDTIVIYANNNGDGIQYFWDGVTDAPTEKKIWIGNPFYSVTNDGSIDDVITNNRTYTYWKTVGRERSPILRSQYQRVGGFSESQTYKLYKEVSKFEFNMSSMDGYRGGILSVDDMTYIVGYKCIYTYGSRVPGKDGGATKYLQLDEVITSNLVEYNGQPYYSYQDADDVTSIRLISLESVAYQSSGCAITNPILRDQHSTEKQTTMVKMGYRLPSSGTSFKVYAGIDNDKLWTFDVTGVSTAPVAGDTYRINTGDVFTVISTDLDGNGDGTISFTANAGTTTFEALNYSGTLVKTVGDGDTNISYTDAQKFVLLKTVTASGGLNGYVSITNQDFQDINMPRRHQMKLKIELSRTSSTNGSPEIYDVKTLATVTNINE